MTGVFVSYRRTDSKHQTARLADRLVPAFGASRVFFDRDEASLPVAVDFAREIDRRVAAAEVVLAIIGEGWLAHNVTTGRSRLSDPDDFVRRELANALAADKTVIPVLLDRASMPKAHDVPDDIARLLDFEAAVLREEAFGRDSDHLIEVLRPLVTDDRSTVRRTFDRYRRVLLPALAVLALAVGVSAALLALHLRVRTRQARMDGSFNIAVAEFATERLDPTSARDRVGIRVAAAVADAVRSTPGVVAPLVWGPDQVGGIADANGVERRLRALDRAAAINADVLVFGSVRDGDAGRARVELTLVIRGANERRPFDPLALEKAFVLGGAIDVRRFSTAQDAQRALPVLRWFGPLFQSVHQLDRDGVDDAIAVLVRVRAEAGAVDPTTPGQRELVSVIDAMLGVGYSRQAEVHVPGALASALDAFERALGTDPGFSYARTGLLGARYLQLVGSPIGDILAIDAGRATGLERLRADYVRLRDDAGAHGAAGAGWAQATNVIGQIDLLLSEAGGQPDAGRRASAIEMFTEVDAAYRRERTAVPELELLANVARSDLGYVKALSGDLPGALASYRSARDIADPYWYAVQSGQIGEIELSLGSPCEAEVDIGRALDGEDPGGGYRPGKDRDRLTASRVRARDACVSSVPSSSG